ncbi:hypothetical protein GOBAR_AA31559 [Gossypium barbadense]|uniref:Uncharacterized protein n=1 Tax=Gossypium barbadense TaxID=3634 RepID=A0A2P5WDG6_GOSBA|nr:hypothetical protein GOBAR_AA31559 [Gossypium barbadense]
MEVGDEEPGGSFSAGSNLPTTSGRSQFANRETNWVADALAKMALSSGNSLRIFESPPIRIKDILQEDKFVDNSLMNRPL